VIAGSLGEFLERVGAS